MEYWTAIANNIDSDDQNSSEFAPMFNIMNEWYLRDCSRKVSAAYRVKGTAGKNDYFNNPVLGAVAAKHSKTPAQTALRFLLQSGVVVIPKSTHKERMIENFNVFDFELDTEDMAALETLDTAQSLFFSHYDPQTVEWFMTFAK